jgi:hypothetical protein
MTSLPLVSILFCGLAAMAQAGEPVVTVSPSEFTAGTYQKIALEFAVGDVAIEAGGGVRWELPTAYLETMPYFWDKPQTELPDGRGFVVGRASSGAQTELKVYGASDGIIECSVTTGTLTTGDTIRVDYSGIVQSVTWHVPVRVQWHGRAGADWKTLKDAPVMKPRSQNAAVLLAVAPTDVVKDTSFTLAVVLLDKFGNRATGYRGTVSFATSDEKARLPGSYTFTEQDAGAHLFGGVRYGSGGFQRITITDGQLSARSNSSAITDATPDLRRWFGDTHFHTGGGMGYKPFTESRLGGDHRGHFITDAEAYEYCRDVMRLDFASSADHDTANFAGDVWKKSQDVTDSFNSPGKFTTLYAYEWTASPANGHHLVMYHDRAGKVLSRIDYPTKPALFEALDKQGTPAMVIPHSMWAQPDHGIFDHLNNKYCRVGEVYSLWNNRFLLAPGDEVQRFEIGINDRWSYQYAWHKGHRLGVIGSSDNHTGHPGCNNYTVDMVHPSGLAVALAKDNSRDAIWDAFQKRRVYATTGVRIYLDFKSDGHDMGDEYATSRPPALSVKVAGTTQIVSVELVKHDGKAYSTIHKSEPGSAMCEFAYTDEKFDADSFYYVRVTQVDEVPRGAWAYPTCEMAWSSPIWVNRKTER